ncbi:MAG: hypothetical protein HOO10_04875 [Candidatus Marinimicrobia bacterium]|jgi:hypothetical protein|nr:hypothetical protein [Candidatus Neomarinimicrobiota bacterium]
MKSDILNLVQKIDGIDKDLKMKTSVEIQNGFIEEKGGYENIYELSNKNGKEREKTYKVIFKIPFRNTPRVNLGISIIDANTTENYLRFYSKTENISNDGFDIVVSTKHKTAIYEFKIEWVAYTQ